jgi:hypothetical protein
VCEIKYSLCEGDQKTCFNGEDCIRNFDAQGKTFYHCQCDAAGSDFSTRDAHEFWYVLYDNYIVLYLYRVLSLTLLRFSCVHPRSLIDYSQLVCFRRVPILTFCFLSTSQHIFTSWCTAKGENIDRHSSFCTNFGVCKDQKGKSKYHAGCDCPGGWTGQHCEVPEYALTAYQKRGHHSTFMIFLVFLMVASAGIVGFFVYYGNDDDRRRGRGRGRRGRYDGFAAEPEMNISAIEFTPVVNNDDVPVVVEDDDDSDDDNPLY